MIRPAAALGLAVHSTMVTSHELRVLTHALIKTTHETAPTGKSPRRNHTVTLSCEWCWLLLAATATVPPSICFRTNLTLMHVDVTAIQRTAR
jgi:hypothetical protein